MSAQKETEFLKFLKKYQMNLEDVVNYFLQYYPDEFEFYFNMEMGKSYRCDVETATMIAEQNTIDKLKKIHEITKP